MKKEIRNIDWIPVKDCRQSRLDKRVWISDVQTTQKGTFCVHLYALPMGIRAWQESVIANNLNDLISEYEKAIIDIGKECDQYDIEGKWSDE